MTKLAENEVFVFGSNSLGKHGRGAALDAMKYFGAVHGVGFGHKGQSFAIPTLCSRFTRLMPLQIEEIEAMVKSFLSYAESRKDLTFVVTRIGCGLAHRTNEEIAPLFVNSPLNCVFSPKWKPFLPAHFKFDERLF